ncbi:MAG: metallophosphoesterase [Thermoplasmata archaeon]
MHEIEIEDGLFLSSNYCAWYRPRNTVIVTDFHLGYESVMREDGVSLPQLQKEKILDRLSNIKNRYDPKTVVVLGDFKHNFGRSEDSDFSDLLDMMDYIMESSSLVMIKGNHDNYLKNLTEIKGVPLYEEKMDMDNITLTHGHKEIVSDGIIIMGHEHPMIELKDDIGSRMLFPSFLYNEKHKVLVLPAIDPMSKGRDVISASSFFSKNIEKLNPEHFHIYAISENGLLNFHKVGDVKRAQPSFD